MESQSEESEMVQDLSMWQCLWALGVRRGEEEEVVVVDSEGVDQRVLCRIDLN